MSKKNKRTILVPVALLAALAVGWLLPLSSADAAPASEVRIATWNTKKKNSTSNIISGIRDIGKNADVIGLAELGIASRRAALRKEFVTCSGCDWATQMPDANHGGKTPIFWKKDRFTLLDKGGVKIYGEQRVEKGAAGTYASTKAITWVRLRDKATKQSFYVLNSHTIATIEAGGKPKKDNPQRLALYRKHMNAIVDLVDKFHKTGDPVVVMGDLNVNYKKDSKVKNSMFPYKRLGSHGLVSNWQVLGAPSGGTHGDRVIDYVFYSKGQKDFVAKSQRLMSKHGSDHKPVVVTFKTVAPKPAPAKPTTTTKAPQPKPVTAKPTSTTKVVKPTTTTTKVGTPTSTTKVVKPTTTTTVTQVPPTTVLPPETTTTTGIPVVPIEPDDDEVVDPDEVVDDEEGPDPDEAIDESDEQESDEQESDEALDDSDDQESDEAGGDTTVTTAVTSTTVGGIVSTPYSPASSTTTTTQSGSVSANSSTVKSTTTTSRAPVTTSTTGYDSVLGTQVLAAPTSTEDEEQLAYTGFDVRSGSLFAMFLLLLGVSALLASLSLRTRQPHY